MTKGLQVQILHASVQVQAPYTADPNGASPHGQPMTITFFSQFGEAHVIELYQDGRVTATCTVAGLRALLAARDRAAEIAKLDQVIADAKAPHTCVNCGYTDKVFPVTPADTPEGKNA